MRPIIEQVHSCVDNSQYAIDLNLHPPSDGIFAQQCAAVDATAKDSSAFVDDAVFIAQYSRPDEIWPAARFVFQSLDEA
eukprot:3261795-Karenia_brevis.AAC.1